MSNGAIDGSVVLVKKGAPRAPKTPGQVDLAQLRENIQEIVRAQSDSYFELAEHITKAFEVAAHRDWGFARWDDFVESELHMSVRKAQYLMSIHNWFGKVIKSEYVTGLMKELGWTKTKILVSVVDEENALEWAKRAKKMTCTQLEEFIKQLKSGAPDEGGASELKTVNFRLHPAQVQALQDALDVAEGIAENNKKGNCLALICDDFTASNRFNMRPGRKMIELYLERISNQLSLNIMASRRDDGAFVAGKDYVTNSITGLSQADKKALWEKLNEEFSS
jgi:hypothetical protein